MSPPRRARTVSASRLVLAVLLAGLLAGCLFPPVAPPGGDGDDPDPRPTTTTGPAPTRGPAGVTEETLLFQDAGQVETSVAVGERRLSTERHTVELPAYGVALGFRLDWEPQAAEDLDVTLRIESDGVTLWSHQADEGRTGAPDRPLERMFELPEDAYQEDAALLVIDIHAELSYETSYTFSGNYTYHAPGP